MRTARLAGFACGLALATLAGAAGAQYRLEISPPPSWSKGWKPASDTGGKDWRLVVYLPADYVEGKPSDLVSVTSTSGNVSKDGGVKRLVEAWALQLKRNCRTLTAVPGEESVGDEFDVGYAEFYCPRQSDTGAGAVDVVKVVAAGHEAHLVAVSHVSAPFKSFATHADWVKAAKDYLRSAVRLCRGPSPLKQECSP